VKVLLLESHPGVANGTVTELMAAGHTIVRCDTPDRRYPCRGFASTGDCPLDEHVDVAVMVQEPGCNQVEHGAVCAIRSRVPVVEIDAVDDTHEVPTMLWTSVPSPRVLEECERAAGDGQWHAQAVCDRLVALGVVTPAELAGPSRVVTISVERDGDRLLMRVVLAESARDREAEILRAATHALREFDRRVGVIDVVVRAR
jgi:hypothetical protein